MVDEIEDIRRRKLEELRRTQMQAAQEDAVHAEVLAKKQAILRQILTPSARERLTNIRMTRPEFASQIEGQLIMLAQSGRLQAMIDDGQLRQILLRIQPKKRDINIRRG
ncbi:MAG: DNA-binding protein [Methanosarcinales archaeon Met12]|nr:MAG: DNA-binding protein [Methanosarcinales archaeon Met12]